EVMGALASEWSNADLASLTCKTAPDVLLCNDQGQVISMQLDGAANALTGGDNFQFPTIPAQIGNLTTLTYLSISTNSLTGSVPDSFSNLAQLQLLDLSANLISKPIDAIMTLSALTFLNVSYNLIRAPLSPGIANLRQLVVLDTSGNNVTKVDALSTLTNLQSLIIQECGIGPAPLTIFTTLTALQDLVLYNNSFEGSLAALSTLTSLQHLNLNSNNIGPDIPSTISRLSKLSYLDLSYTLLSGPIDPLTTLPALKDLFLYNTAVSGSFPESISRLSHLAMLVISRTKFTGSLPASLGQMLSLTYFYLDKTTMVGSIPAALGNLTRLQQISFEPMSNTVGPKCGKGGACVVNQTAESAFCNSCLDFCISCSPPGLCAGCKVSPPQPPPPLPASSGNSSSGSSGSSDGGGGLSAGAIIGIVCGVVVLLLAMLLAVLFFLYRRNKVSRFGALAAGVCVEYTMKEMQQATNNWSDANLLGSGGFGDVYKGVSPQDGTTLWAVKRAKVITNDFQREVHEMATKHHPNLVRLLGYATCGDLRERIEQILVYEFISNGDLEKWLGADAPSPLTLRQRLDIIVGAARGFEYLHGFGIVHRDIKPANILLDSNMHPKVADFGLVRVEEGTSAQATRVMGTPGYVDPAYSRTRKATPATDVYSFGILMLVVLTGKPATYEDDTNHSRGILKWVQEKLGQGGTIEEIADACMGPVPPDVLQRITDLAMRCTATFTADRPSMGRIAQEMDALRGEVGGGEEQQVHKAYEVVDAELRARMQQQQKMSEQSMDSFLDSIHSGKIRSMRDTGGMSTGDASNV
ncbi:unnamed protein product, partial [Closterium sp. NIES-54]